MRELFPDFYERDEAEWKALWEHALFVLDANVLLRLSVLPPNGQQELFDVLESLKERIWVPHQAALEYQRNRSNKLKNAVSELRRHCVSVSDGLKSAAEAISKLELEKWNLSDEKATMDAQIAQFRTTVDGLNQKLEAKFAAMEDDSQVRSRLDQLLRGSIGDGPQNEEEMLALVKDGAARYTAKIPPGFNDAGKADEAEPTFRHNGLTYERQYGDLILWRQLLSHARASGLQRLIFVTEDRKPDWWKKDSRKDITGLHPDLVYEAKTVGGIEDFHMYTLTQFLTRAKGQLNAKVSDETIQEIEASSKLSPLGFILGTQAPDHAKNTVGTQQEKDAPWRESLLPYLADFFEPISPISGTHLLRDADAPDFLGILPNEKKMYITIMDLTAFPRNLWAILLEIKIRAQIKMGLDGSLLYVLPSKNKKSLAILRSEFQKILSVLASEDNPQIVGMFLHATREGEVLESEVL